MAKRRNKTQKIREVLDAHPTATAKEIVTRLAAQRVRVSAGQVYNIKSATGKLTNGRHRPKTAKYEDLLRAKEFADAMGSVEKAHGALDLLATLQ